MEQLTTELSLERSAGQKAEAERQSLERQNKDLRVKVAELETSAKTRAKAQIAALESKIGNLQEQLDTESK